MLSSHLQDKSQTLSTQAQSLLEICHGVLLPTSSHNSNRSMGRSDFESKSYHQGVSLTIWGRGWLGYEVISLGLTEFRGNSLFKACCEMEVLDRVVIGSCNSNSSTKGPRTLINCSIRAFSSSTSSTENDLQSFLAIFIAFGVLCEGFLGVFSIHCRFYCRERLGS